jgi:GAF domain-containing protein
MATDDLTDRLAVLARQLQSQVGSGSIAQLICEAAVDWIDGDLAAGITLVHRGRRLETAAATSDVVRRGDALQYELMEGPCVDAAWAQEQVYSPDLRSESRWQTWGPRVADELGVRSMLCTRLFTNENTLGALNLYAGHAAAFDDDDREDTRALAAHAAVAVAAASEIEGLKIAVDRRTTIGKALGMLMERYDIGDAAAFGLLHRIASDNNRKIHDLAEHLVRTRRLPTS